MRELGEAHRIQINQTRHLLELKELGITIAVGDMPGYKCEIPFGFQVVFSIEELPKKTNPAQSCGWFRHLSVSIPQGQRHRVPNQFALEMIAKELGFQKSLKDWAVYLENEDTGHPAVNVLEPIE